MKTIPKELETLISQSEFKKYHRRCGDKFTNDVRRFLTATMDEVRITIANRAGLEVLKTIGLGDFALFREAVTIRELTGEIAYVNQRDHSSHTLYNYLLGWYFFIQSGRLKKALVEEFDKRGVPGFTFPFTDYSTYFGCIWQYVSLLHDIGYMFEGGLSKLSFSSNEQAQHGAKKAREYFNRSVLQDYQTNRPTLVKELGEELAPPAFADIDTLGKISSELQFIGNLKQLLEQVAGAFDKTSVPKPNPADYSNDGFDLWIQYYDCFDNRRMARRFRSLRRVFDKLIDSGLPEKDVCLLDHGVCGGLLQLLASTYYYRLHAGARLASRAGSQVAQRIRALDWSPAFWWSGIVWGTAAAGLHNIQQMSAAKKLDDNWPGKLRLSDDPLAYLGILVDIIQEWNRYSVFKKLDSEPIQGIEVELGSESGKIFLRFKEPDAVKRAKKVRGELDQALAGWRDLLEIQQER
jgi:hypothetical protein